jgi:ClpP class serine protease
MSFAAVIRHQSLAIHPEALRSLCAQADAVGALIARGLDAPQASSPSERLSDAWNGRNPIKPEIVNGVASIEIIGAICGRAPWWAKAYMGVVDPFDVADAIDALATDATVTSLVLEIDSGGGTTNGTAEAAAAITRFQAAGKTVEVRATGMLCSAAYWIAAGADRIIASPLTLVGSLGTYLTLCDSTAADAEMGLRYEVRSSGPLKGMGADGAITQPLRDWAQRMADGITAVFKDAVAAGRGIANVDALFTGDVWLAGQAQALGLIDAVDSPADEIDADPGTATPPQPAAPPLSPSDSPESHASTQAAAAATEQESIMDAKTMAALSALSDKHPALAHALIKQANQPTATAESLQAFAAEESAKAKDAEIAALKARAEQAEKSRDDEKTRADKAAADLAKAKAHGQSTDVGGDDQGAGQKMNAEAFAKLDLTAQEKFLKDGGKVLG